MVEMEGLRNLRSVGDIKTALSARIRSTATRKGTAHRDLFLLSIEKERLERELERLAWQRGRVQQHLDKTMETMAKLQQEAQRDDLPERTSASAGLADGDRPTPALQSPSPWRTIPLDY